VLSLVLAADEAVVVTHPEPTAMASAYALMKVILRREAGYLHVLEDGEQRRFVSRLIDGLPERERQVLDPYYYEELTMHDIGQLLGVTESRVSQMQSCGVLRLRAALRRQRAHTGTRAATRRHAVSGSTVTPR
jgi:DNA-directed RNA polymerase specialized sigma24 family protein